MPVICIYTMFIQVYDIERKSFFVANENDLDLFKVG